MYEASGKTHKEIEQGKRELCICGLSVFCFKHRKMYHVLLYVTVGSFETTHYHHNSEILDVLSMYYKGNLTECPHNSKHTKSLLRSVFHNSCMCPF